MDQCPINLALTGFGPFENIKENPSWKVVQNTARVLINNEQVRLVCVTQLPVIYDTIRDVVDTIHQELKPDLTVHIGLAKGCDMIRIEYQSFNHSYTYGDVNGNVPDGWRVKKGGKIRLRTSLNIEKLLQATNDQFHIVKCRMSATPGDYVCGYCYYVSLCNNSSSLFIHIPDTDEPYSLQQLSDAVVCIVNTAVDQIQEKRMCLDICRIGNK